VRLRWLTAEEAERLLAACRVSKEADLTDVVEFCSAAFAKGRQPNRALPDRVSNGLSRLRRR